jgi:hypothetical protein
MELLSIIIPPMITCTIIMHSLTKLATLSLVDIIRRHLKNRILVQDRGGAEF